MTGILQPDTVGAVVKRFAENAQNQTIKLNQSRNYNLFQ
jgi:hypothetical protein